MLEVERKELGKMKKRKMRKKGITTSRKRSGGNMKTEKMGDEPSWSKVGNRLNTKIGGGQTPW